MIPFLLKNWKRLKNPKQGDFCRTFRPDSYLDPDFFEMRIAEG